MEEAICPAKRSFVLGAENVGTPPFVPEPLAVTAMELLAALNRQS